ncbi:hypothetical protein [Winogradskyella marincola]|uniref:DUF4349 domain-containing protein n=1 Tax=Winogradskyella marincola TaxID=3037795 RepID=A0ABT6FZJ5_9FLAO|nr:hypothetical protein [Winogradskyella sp. YYF002]MDG4715209.1 hypothetical protein [Winogradskyella sp. YYF002]
MSQTTPQGSHNEEVDLIQIFKYIGKFFDRIFNFIASIFKAIFSVFIYALKAIVNNFKIIVIVLLLAGVLGFILQRTQKDIYESQMLVKPYFDSKFQLVTNINYYNALIGEKDYTQLTSIFEIDEESAKQIIEFEIHPGPENENDKIKQYDTFLKSLDSTRAQNISFDEFVENRSIYSGDVFEINVKSFKKDIFRSLEEGLNSTFTNTYSVKKREKRDSLIYIERNRILASIKEADSLQNVYLRVMEEESKMKDGSYTTKDGMSFIREKTKTREYDLLQEVNKLREELGKLDAQKVEEDVYFDTLSSFQDVGAKYSSIWNLYVLIMPMIAFILLCVVYLSNRLIKYVSSYEG